MPRRSAIRSTTPRTSSSPAWRWRSPSTGASSTSARRGKRTSAASTSRCCLSAWSWPTLLVVPAAIAVAAVFGAAWAFVPAWLQARRGSHVVITTIMFNFIATALMTHLLVNVLIKPGQQSPETREFDANTWLPQLYDVARAFGLDLGRSPLNVSFVLALMAGAAIWVYVWHTRWGYELRAFGCNETAAVYGGISPARTVMVRSGRSVAARRASGEPARLADPGRLVADDRSLAQRGGAPAPRRGRGSSRAPSSRRASRGRGGGGFRR